MLCKNNLVQNLGAGPHFLLNNFPTMSLLTCVLNKMKSNFIDTKKIFKIHYPFFYDIKLRFDND